MSIKLMSAVWEMDGIDSSEKLVLLALADHANDDGNCYPGNSRLAKRTGMSGRGVQKVLQRLVSKGLLHINQNAGKGGANVYSMLLTPEHSSPPNDIHPRTQFTTPPNVVPNTPEPRSPKTSRTIKEPSVKRQTRIPEDAVISDKQMAAASKRQLSEQEAEAQFDKFKNDALAKGKTFVDWDRAFITWLDSPYFKIITGGRYDQRIANRNGGSQGRENRPDAALEQIARLAGLGASSGNGSF